MQKFDYVNVLVQTRAHNAHTRVVVRVKRDVADIASDPPRGIYVVPNENDITNIDALVVGPSDTPYECGFLLFPLACPPEYPIEPTRVRVLTTDAGRVVALHPVFYQIGDVSLSILGTYAGHPWSSAQSFCSLLVSIRYSCSAMTLSTKARRCPHCAEKSSDIFHVVWAYLAPKPNPTREDWEAALLGCSDLASQMALVDRARVAAVANGLL
ncbi:ubiquitin-conjugating enzyme E2 Z-like [Rhipicephalus sanguineus]|uniref:ubiquitin-conjugating enzyme E2 Z-like n=1 Tax=Rhipicephalus sanguineus TaxID=34632 RepID=UPI001894072A|nr:ubiquitin-conjugating enzyme E2 Z-like [Rhipicephalus sanguineus]